MITIEEIRRKILKLENEMSELDHERRNAHSRRKMAIDEEIQDIRSQLGRLRKQLEEGVECVA